VGGVCWQGLGLFIFVTNFVRALCVGKLVTNVNKVKPVSVEGIKLYLIVCWPVSITETAYLPPFYRLFTAYLPPIYRLFTAFLAFFGLIYVLRVQSDSRNTSREQTEHQIDKINSQMYTIVYKCKQSNPFATA
jgi:hypothetical protein